MNLIYKLRRKVQNFGKEIPDGNVFVLKHRYGFQCGRVERTNFQAFKKPDEFSNEDVYTVLSYYIKWIENRMNFEPCSKYAIETLDAIIEDLGFKHLKSGEVVEVPIPLYTLVNYNTKLDDYFEWFTNNVSLKDVIRIYEKANLKFKDPEEVYENYLKHLEITHKKTATEM